MKGTQIKIITRRFKTNPYFFQYTSGKKHKRHFVYSRVTDVGRIFSHRPFFVHRRLRHFTKESDLRLLLHWVTKMRKGFDVPSSLNLNYKSTSLIEFEGENIRKTKRQIKLFEWHIHCKITLDEFYERPSSFLHSIRNFCFCFCSGLRLMWLYTSNKIYTRVSC